MKLALIGYGKMGRAIEELALAAGHEVVLRIRSSAGTNWDRQQLKQADVALEFTRPESAVNYLKLCFELGVPVVCGTTGWLDQLADVLAARDHYDGGFFYASNFSIGVNMAFHLNRVLAAMMNDQPDYRTEMTEIHHTQKLDAPSGTAITLAEDIIAEIGRLDEWILQTEQKMPNQLPITSLREGQVPGTHEIRYISDIDTITLRHEAHSREGFARGALRAVEWMNNRKGYYGMKDLLGF